MTNTQHNTPAPRPRITAGTRKAVILSLQWGISAGALLYALWGIDFNSLLHALGRYAYVPMLAVILCIMLDYLLMTARLHSLLPVQTRWRICLQGLILCLGYNNILPAKAGDAIKLVFLAKNCNLSLTAMAPVVLWERLMDVCVLILLGCCAITVSDQSLSFTVPAALFLLIVCCFALARLYSPLFHRLYDKIPHAATAATLNSLHHHVVDSVGLAWITKAFIISISIWLCYIASFYIALNFVANLNLTWAQVLTVFVVTSLGAAIPSSPGGIGVFEGAMVFSLAWYNVGRDEALGIALFIHALYFLPISLMALYVSRQATRKL